MAELDEYEQHFNQQISKFKEEFDSLDEMEQYLRFNSVEIDQSNKERKEVRTKHNEITNQVTTLNLEKQQLERGREFIQDRLLKLESELDDFETQTQANVKKLVKLDLEKKKFAAAKKFKDAGKCQQEIKEI